VEEIGVELGLILVLTRAQCTSRIASPQACAFSHAGFKGHARTMSSHIVPRLLRDSGHRRKSCKSFTIKAFRGLLKVFYQAAPQATVS
jgi:hypothetical protein